MGPGDAETLPADDAAPAVDAELPVVDPSNYELGAELARGGFGRLISARDRRLDRVVAIKQLRATNAQLEARFRLEARLTARLAHPAIVPVHEVGRWPSGEPFYAMKLVTGRSLREQLDATPGFEDRLALLPQLATVVDAIAYAHREGVLHRDLKPSNLMLDDKGHAYVVDWGLAKDRRGEDVPVAEAVESAADLTVAGSVLGTPPYLAPEQARGEVVDERADVYSLGALLYELLAGSPPYAGDTAEMLAAIASGPPPALLARQPAAPRELVAIVERAMAREPGARYANGGELAAELTRFARGDLVHAYRYSAAQRALRWLRRHRQIAVALALVVVASGATALWLGTRPAPRVWRPQIRELPAFEENSEAPSFSPDGHSIAFESTRDTPRLVPWIETLDGEAHSIPAPDGYGHAVRFSRDGTSIYYVSQAGGYKAPISGGAGELVFPDARFVEDCGEGLLVIRKTGQPCVACASEIALIGRDGNTRVLQRFGADRFVGWLRCDRVGHRYAYTLGTHSRETTPFDLFVAELSGGPPRPLMTAVPYGMYPTLHPDGRSIVFSSDRGGAMNLWELPIDSGGPAQQLTFGGGPDLAPDISADGKQLLFDVDVTSTPLFELSCSHPPRRLTPGLINVRWLALNRAGTKLVYETGDAKGSSLVMRTLATGEEHIVGHGHLPAFGPHDELYWLDGRSVFVAPSAGAAGVKLADLPGSSAGMVVDDLGTVHTMVYRDQGAEAWRVEPNGVAAVETEGSVIVLPARGTGWRANIKSGKTAELVPPGGHIGDPKNEVLAVEFREWDAAGTSFLFARDGVHMRHDVIQRTDETLCDLGPDIVWLTVSPDRATFYAAVRVGRVRREIITNYGERPRP